MCAYAYVCARVCLACVTGVGQPVSGPGCAHPPLPPLLPSQPLPPLPACPLLLKVLRSCSVLGTMSLKPQHSQRSRCPHSTSPPFHRREGKGSERGGACLRKWQSQNRDPSRSQKCLLLSKVNSSLLTPVQVPLSPSPFSSTAGPELRCVLHGGMEGFPCTWPAGEVMVPPQVLRPGALPGGGGLTV